MELLLNKFQVQLNRQLLIAHHAHAMLKTKFKWRKLRNYVTLKFVETLRLKKVFALKNALKRKKLQLASSKKSAQAKQLMEHKPHQLLHHLGMKAALID